VLLNLVAAHGALDPRCGLVLLDGKWVELGQWRECADVFVGPNITEATTVLRRLQTMMDNRYAFLMAHGRRKIGREDDMRPYLVILDEIAYFSATAGDKK
jgi:S-DNA-T family DNA segregation ATPase FtsK/SpoIIIE